LCLLYLHALGDSGINLVESHQRIHCSDVHHRLAFLAVQVHQPHQRLCPIELKDKGQICIQGRPGEALALLAKGDTLPVLSLVLTEVQELEGLTALNAEQALACGVDSEAGEVTTNPTTAQLLCRYERRSRATKDVSHKGSGLRRCCQYPVEYGCRLLRR